MDYVKKLFVRWYCRRNSNWTYYVSLANNPESYIDIVTAMFSDRIVTRWRLLVLDVYTEDVVYNNGDVRITILYELMRNCLEKCLES